MDCNPEYWREQHRRLRLSSAEPDSSPISLYRLPDVFAALGLKCRPSYQVCKRWTKDGHAGIRLATSSDGRKVYTTLDAIRTFVREAGIQ